MTVGKGITSKDKGTFVPLEKRLTPRPEYGKMSKAEVVAAEKVRKENDLKAAQFRESLEKPRAEAPTTQAPAPEKKKVGRPKKIE